LSQLELALQAETTPRHVSFIETGRSRPGRDLVLRLAACMGLQLRDRNKLLVAAGLRPVYAEHELDDDLLRPFLGAVRAVLDHHDPYPGCALDALGQVKMSNAGFRAFMPGAEELTPEEAMDGFLAPGGGRDMFENWAEVAWATVDRMRHDLRRTHHPRLAALTERALRHLDGVPRPDTMAGPSSPVLGLRLRVGDQVIRTFTTVMRFDTAQEVTMSELRVELIFPMDDAAATFLRGLTERSPD